MQNERVRRNLLSQHAYIAIANDIDEIGKLCEIHYHDELELLLITRGTLGCIIDGEMLTVQSGQVLFVNSRVPHWTESLSADCQYILLQFSPDRFESASNVSKTVAHYFYNFTRKNQRAAMIIENDGCAFAIRSAWEEYSARQNGSDKFLLSCIYYLLGWLERSGCIAVEALPDEQSVQKLAPALEYIERHYGKQELSLEQVSGVLGLNPAYFCRLFKHATGHGFTEYLNFVRITKSEALLRDTSLSILEISLEVGFSSVSYFNRVFKRIKNCTPSVYRSALYSSI